MRRHRKTFLIDIDGVACNHAEAICMWVNKHFDIKSKVDDVKSWDHDFGPITFTKAVTICYQDDKFISEMNVHEGFVDFVKILEQKMDIKFATTRKCAKEQTRQWISKYYGKYEIYFVDRKIDIFFNYLLDDNDDEAIAAAERGRICYLISRPWNDNEYVKKKIMTYKNIVYARSLKDIIESSLIDRFGFIYEKGCQTQSKIEY